MASNDPTPGNVKAYTAVGASLLGGALSAYVVNIIRHIWPWLMDPATEQATPIILTSIITGISVYLVPHQTGGGQ